MPGDGSPPALAHEQKAFRVASRRGTTGERVEVSLRVSCRTDNFEEGQPAPDDANPQILPYSVRSAVTGSTVWRGAPVAKTLGLPLRASKVEIRSRN